MSVVGDGFWDADPEDIRWRFDPTDSGLNGTFEIAIPVRWQPEAAATSVFPAELYEQARNTWRMLRISVIINETLSREMRADSVFPPDLPLRNHLPFDARVDIIEHVYRETPPPGPEQMSLAEQDPPATRERYSWEPGFTVNIRIFALTGVGVNAFLAIGQAPEKKIEPFRERVGPMMLSLQIDKLCRPESLPAPEEPIETRRVYPSYPVDLYPRTTRAGGGAGPPLLKELGRFMVSHRPNRVDISWSATQQTLTLAIRDPGDAEAGFTYWFNSNPELTPGLRGRARRDDFLLYDDLLHVHVSGKIDVFLTKPVNPPVDTVRSAYIGIDGTGRLRIRDDLDLFGLVAETDDPLDADEAILAGPVLDDPYSRYFVDPFAWDNEIDETALLQVTRGTTLNSRDYKAAEDAPPLLRPLVESRFFRLERHTKAADLPAFGARAIILDDPVYDEAQTKIREYMNPKTPPSGISPWAQIGSEVALGFLAPGISDMADYAEFNYALATGKDRWGNEVQDWELVLMAMSVIPLVGTAFKVPSWIRRVFR